MKMRSISFGLILCALASAGFFLYPKNERKSVVSLLTEFVTSFPQRLPNTHKPPIEINPPDKALLEDENAGVLLDQVQHAYSDLSSDRKDAEKIEKSLEKLSIGLFSKNETVVRTTEDIFQNLLTLWVRTQDPSQWHRSSRIDSIYKYFASRDPRSLREFFEILPDGPESQYLNEI